MNSKKFLYLFFGLTLIATACKKKNDEQATPPDSNSGRLKAIKIQTDTKEYEVTLYDYDAQGRVSRVRSYNVDSAVSPVSIDSGTTVSYFYSSGNRPARYNYYDGGSFLFSGILTFNTSGQLLRDSTNTSPNGYVSLVRYVGNITIATTTVTPPGGFPPFVQTDSVYTTSSNITRFASTQRLGVSEQVSTYTYGTIQSPIYDLNITYGIPYEWMGLSSRNLPITEQVYSGNTLDYSGTYTHITGSNGKVSKTTVAVAGINVPVFWEYY